MGDVLSNEDDPRVAELRARLDQFYSSACEYTAFNSINSVPGFWAPVREEIGRLVDCRKGGQGEYQRCRILEFGAGTSGFGEFIASMREDVELHAQDVTARNADFLRGHCDCVYVSDVFALSGPYDVIFSTFVWEHITNPRAVLGHLLSILSPGGSLFLASPRYDLPGYIPPTARHYTRARVALMMFRLYVRRVVVLAGGAPDFLIHLDPAMFHRPWYRDADAVHWVSLHDIRRALPGGFHISRVRYSDPGERQRGVSCIRGWLWRTFCLLFVHIKKPVGSTGPRGRQARTA